MEKIDIKTNLYNLINDVTKNYNYEQQVLCIDKICNFLDSVDGDIPYNVTSTLVDYITNIFSEVNGEFSESEFSKKFDLILVELVSLYDEI